LSRLVLGIETSCDDTSVAVLEDGVRLRSHLIAAQDLHELYGGVVPELAARHHLEQIDLVVDLALQRASLGLGDLDGVAVTYGPGLVGPLLVGLQAAKGIAWGRSLPLLAVNHLEGHLRSVFLEHGDVPAPSVSLVASGGHTGLYLLSEDGVLLRLARTRDDAAGEAFDKVAKLLGLGYPGGPVVDRLATTGNPLAIPFAPPRMSDGSLDFSFSGFKTAVLRYAQAHRLDRDLHVQAADAAAPDQETRDLLASFQSSVVEFMVNRLMTVAEDHGARAVCLSGGVACNSLLRRRVEEEARRRGLAAFTVSRALAVDNAAMIAEVGRLKYLRGEHAPMSLNADPGLEL